MAMVTQKYRIGLTREFHFLDGTATCIGCSLCSLYRLTVSLHSKIWGYVHLLMAKNGNQFCKGFVNETEEEIRFGLC